MSDDLELMQRIARHEQSALSELYQRYGNLIYSIALRVLQNGPLAEEVTQDTFLEVWKNPDRWDPARGKLTSWMLTITRYTAIDRLRKEQRLPDLTSTPLEEIHHLTASTDQPDDPAWLDSQIIQEAMAQLPPEQAQVIELAFFQGMSHSEMAEALHLPLGTIKTRVRLGLQKLKALWEAGNS